MAHEPRRLSPCSLKKSSQDGLVESTSLLIRPDSYMAVFSPTFARSRESEVRGQRSEVRSQRSEVRGQRSEVRGQKSEVRSQRSEVRGQRSEVRGQRSFKLTS